MKIILASKSPRRREILENLNIDFKIVVSSAEEKSEKSDVSELVKELSFQKADNVKKTLVLSGEYNDDTLIIGCDTVVCVDGEVLGKPKDSDDAFRMLKLISGREHSVLSGLTLIYGDKVLTDFEETKVRFDKISDGEISEYIKTGEPSDKAGAYAVQGIASKYVSGIDGCYFNVVGLPTHLLAQLSNKLGIKLF